MQLPLRVWDHSSPLEPAPPDAGWSNRAPRRLVLLSGPKKIGVVATIGVHLLVVAGLLIHWGATTTRPAEPMVFVQLAEATPEKPVLVPRPPELKPTKVDLTRLDIPQIEEPTNAITQYRDPPPPAPSKAARESYAAKLFRHLYSHKRPAKQRGIVYISFTIDETGRVLGQRITKSSGVPALDSEALALIQRSSPVPAPPDGMIRGQGDVALPIEFTLN